jgi:hypothetical protein
MIKYIILLFTKFLRTEIIGFIELTIWLIIKNLDIYLMLWNTESVRPTMILSLLIIPLLSAIQEYQQKKRDIDSIIKKLSLSFRGVERQAKRHTLHA